MANPDKINRLIGKKGIPAGAGDPRANVAAAVRVTSRRSRMQHVHDGQCGLCTHFGETHEQDRQLLEIRRRHEAPEQLLDDCGHPRHASLHLKVTPISGCDGFEPARA